MKVYIAQKGNGIYHNEVLCVATTNKKALKQGLKNWRKEFERSEVLPQEKDVDVIEMEVI